MIFQIFDKECQKYLYLVMVNAKRSKVMKFGEPTPDYTVVAGGFTVGEGGHNGPHG